MGLQIKSGPKWEDDTLNHIKRNGQKKIGKNGPKETILICLVNNAIVAQWLSTSLVRKGTSVRLRPMAQVMWEVGLTAAIL